MPFDGDVQNYAKLNSNEQVRADLIAARDLIKKGWTQGTPARTKGLFRDEPVRVEDPRATHFCTVGALRRVIGEDEIRYRASYRALQDVAGHHQTIVSWNDDSSKKKVLAGFNKAIEYTR